MNIHFSPEYFRHERSSLLENVGGDVEGREQELRLDVLVCKQIATKSDFCLSRSKVEEK